MSRTELVIATAAALFGAFLLGWLASWAVQRLSRRSDADLDELDRLSRALHDAEEARDDALARADACEGDLAVTARALGEARSEADALRAWIERTQAAGG